MLEGKHKKVYILFLADFNWRTPGRIPTIQLIKFHIFTYILTYMFPYSIVTFLIERENLICIDCFPKMSCAQTLSQLVISLIYPSYTHIYRHWINTLRPKLSTRIEKIARFLVVSRLLWIYKQESVFQDILRYKRDIQ